MRSFILHAHFYQPERLNPWTGELDPEPSAAPDRDWNQRILRECYRPNAYARIFDTQRRVERIVNNYERLSFNMGPTLLSWLEEADPDSYARVLDGDWRSTVRTGHGNAVAQAYNHMILPLASDRDRRTQLAWGLADFAHRFGRPAEGLWLPETACDQPTVDALVEAGVAFTVLAPHQVARIRRAGGEWAEAGEGLDTSRPYRLLHSDGSGRWVACFVYDGGLAQSLAFDPTSADSAVLLERISSARQDEGLVNAALDGETFGHHHAFGELGLAYTLFEEAEQRGLQPTSYAAYLAEHPPVDDAEVVGGEGTAWSCAHGVGRWYRDCGCATDSLPGWNQAWRTPLRRALDLVRDVGAELFAEHGGRLMKDPWAARDDYIQVKLGAWSRAAFLERHAVRNLDERSHVDLWTLLEAQRHAMVMYTSCGWFFADVAGIETVYVLRSAARVLDLLAEACPQAPVAKVNADVQEALAEAQSNQPGVGSGADVWRDRVAQSAVTPSRLAAHFSLVGLVRGPDTPDSVTSSGYTVSAPQQRSETRGRVGLTTARLELESLTTTRRHAYATAAVHLGGLDFYGVVAPYENDEAFAAKADALWQAFPTAPVARLIHLVGEHFQGEAFDVDQALPHRRQELVGELFSSLTQRFQVEYARLYHDHQRVLEMLAAGGYELPRELRAAAELTLTAELDRHIATSADGDSGQLEAVKRILVHARANGYHLDLTGLEQILHAGVTGAARRAAANLDPADVDEVERWWAQAGELHIDIDLSRAQEHAYAAAQRARTGRLTHTRAEQAARLGAMLGLAPVAWSAAPASG